MSHSPKEYSQSAMLWLFSSTAKAAIIINQKSMAAQQKSVLAGQWTDPDEPADIFGTFDLGAAAALVLTGFDLLSLDKDNPKKMRFIFRKDPAIEEAVKQYWADSLSVEARGYFDTLKMLKNRIYSE